MQKIIAAIFILFTLSTPAMAGGKGSITLYSDYNFRGQSITFETDQRDLKDSGWHNKARSFVVNSGTWEVCDKRKFSGCKTFNRGDSVANLKRVGLNEDISSLNKLKKGEAFLRDDDNDRYDRGYHERKNDDYSWNRNKNDNITWNDNSSRYNDYNRRNYVRIDYECKNNLERAFQQRFGTTMFMEINPATNKSGFINFRGRTYNYICNDYQTNIW